MITSPPNFRFQHVIFTNLDKFNEHHAVLYLNSAETAGIDPEWFPKTEVDELHAISIKKKDNGVLVELSQDGNTHTHFIEYDKLQNSSLSYLSDLYCRLGLTV